jgi:hypothetical protein
VGVQTLASARAALEATRNTPVTPATRLIYFDSGVHTQEVGTIRPTELRGSYVEAFRSYPGMERNTLTFGGDWTYDDAAYWLNLGVKTVLSGSLSDTSAYTYTFLPTHTSDDQKSATIEFSTVDLISTVGWRVPGCLVNELEVTWRKGETVRYNATVMSAKGATQITAFTGSLSDRTTVSALGTTTQVYVDSTTIGTTLDPKITEATFNLNNGYSYFDPLNDSNVAESLVRANARQPRLTLQRRFNDKTELDAYVAKTPRKIRVQTLGPLAGAATAKYTIQLNFVGVIDTYTWAEVDGIWMADMSLLPQYDATLAYDFAWVIINKTASYT